MSLENLKLKVSEILQQVNEIPETKMKQVCELLQSNISYYNWVGFYFANHEAQTLHLKAYAGEATDHTVIPFGKGICGQVAVSNENFVVADVKAQDNYIACSINVKAEIVVPLFKDGKNIGQIDIDSHSADPFTKADEVFLEWVNGQIAIII